MKRYCLTVLIFVLLAAALSACGGSDGTAPKGVAVEKNSAGKDDAGDGAAGDGAYEYRQFAGAPIDRYEPVDLGGRTINCNFYYTSSDPNSMHPSGPKPVISDEGVLQSHIYIWENLKRVSEKYNIEFNFMGIPWGEHYELFLTSVMSGDPAYDIFEMTYYYTLNCTQKGFVYSFDEFMPKDADAVNGQEYVVKGAPLMGKEYFFDFRQPYYDAPMLGVNLDIIEAIGAPNPVDLYNSGEWTWDAFLEICKLATRDIDGDGEIDQWGYGGPCQILSQCLIATNSGSIIDTETVTQRLDSPNTMEALQFMGDLYNVHKVAYSTPASTTTFDEDHDYNGNVREFLNGTVCFFTHLAWHLPNGDERLPYRFALVPHPKGPSSTDDYTYLAGIGGDCIPMGVKDPTVVYQIFEEMQYWWGDDYSIAEAGITDYAFQKYYDVEDWYRSRYNDENNGKVDLISITYLNEMSPVAVPIIRGEMTVSQAVEENKSSMEYKIRSGLFDE